MPRIQISPEYTIAARYIDVEEGEQLCTVCNGSGEVVRIHGWPHAGGNTMGYCFDCHGRGKIAYCTVCGQQRDIVKHPGAPWMDSMCLPCITADERFKTLTGK